MDACSLCITLSILVIHLDDSNNEVSGMGIEGLKQILKFHLMTDFPFWRHTSGRVHPIFCIVLFHVRFSRSSTS
jgi:hypothetical protein